ncbi:DUF4136 domain-containing protein [Microbulbifer thermotolerans]|uniref:DUF4136 domain-containing protein n=1 Tax=Microbulbifer thermotolerans TaxID=252514 RepID=A0AB35HU83_MICTH|nr:DUF4136 domain-containing protein [Microbulbifer thermotolerans]MCX2778138.1 DUF4136 domain-containing protein [Microbulbifer thermotolerans]MCX2782228.1 DUF4136 domain-containing protein [Microbulbifer thermotolerans]MCX2801118.1 DUF4136 domain-containing protein [Microbulbifer thermotolerans]MCX2804486.1 DUF4136 domain-containing protein [Microbulbifer thermotolerans]MCX2841309.1 DUF4136 domain-containing protein [Microbulbifer thermotolerans]
MRTVIVGLLGLLLAACQDVQVQRIEPAAAPVAFSTYAWSQAALSDVPEASAQLVELDQEMRAAVTAELQMRGYRQVEDTGSADMLVDYQVAVVEETFSGDPTDPSWDAQFDSNAPAGVVELPARTGAPRVTLTLGIGRADSVPIWGGSATKLLTRPESAEERQRVIGNTVRELLKDLPAAY